MKEFKPIPIGVEDFKRLVDDGYYFVDKTLMIKEILDKKGAVNLFTRPRRFGKTLNLSMLQRFFEKTDEDNAYLFNDLCIAQAGEKYMQHQGQYPVISLSLKSMKQPDYSKSFGTFKDIMKREFWRHKDILSSNEIVPEDREIFSQITHGTAEDDTYITAIRTLSDCLYAAYQKKVIILIDEYDVPLEASHFRGFYDEMVDLIRSVFESALKTNPYLEFGVLTGCLRVSKESIFTGLNNLKVNTINTLDFRDCFGFTEDEVKEMTEYYGISDRFPEMKEWYDGYLFGQKEIYNPWSIINFVSDAKSDHNSLLQPYWSNTSSNDIIHELVVNGNEETHNQIEVLMNGESLTKPIYEDITYRNININTDYIWSFLLFTGYLKPVQLFKGTDNLTYAKLVIPNIEVQTIYQTMIMQWFDEKVRSTSRDDLFTAMISGDVDEFETLLSDWLDETISYYDSKENYYHGFLSGLLVGFKGYDVKSNRESGDGRPDLLVLERKRHKLAVIVEIKVAERFRDLDAKCDEALQQIEENRYEAELKYDCFQKILKYGVAFCDKACQVKLAVAE